MGHTIRLFSELFLLSLKPVHCRLTTGYGSLEDNDRAFALASQGFVCLHVNPRFVRLSCAISSIDRKYSVVRARVQALNWETIQQLLFSRFVMLRAMALPKTMSWASVWRVRVLQRAICWAWMSSAFAIRRALEWLEIRRLPLHCFSKPLTKVCPVLIGRLTRGWFCL